MTELSRVWDGTLTGDATDAPYDSSDFSEVLQTLAAAEAIPTNKSGVFRGVDNILGYTIGANKVTINTGKALVAGRWYRNTAAKDLTIGDASIGRRDRVVLRRSTAAQTVRLTVISGIDNGSGTAPAMTQDASTWDEPLYIFNKAPGVGAAITLITDNREYIPRHGDVSGEGSAAAHAYAQISGAPASADSAPVNAGLTRTASAGSDTGHYANDDHVHKVDAIPSSKATANASSSGLSTAVTGLAVPVEAGIAYILEGGFYLVGAVSLAIGLPSGAIIGGGYIGADTVDPTIVVAATTTLGFTSGGTYVHYTATILIGGSGGNITASFVAYPSGTSTVLAGSWLRATPIT